MTMHLDHDELHRLLDRLSDSDFSEFRLEGQDFRLEVKRELSVPGSDLASSPKPPLDNTSTSSQLIVESSSESSSFIASPSSPPPSVATSRSDVVEITSPMVGTFYRAPAPGEAVFAEIGSRIVVGQTICIIEAMKLMNELESEVKGEIVEILVENGTPVEFGQVLMRVKP